jgi:hypothetical protein
VVKGGCSLIGHNAHETPLAAERRAYTCCDEPRIAVSRQHDPRSKLSKAIPNASASIDY